MVLTTSYAPSGKARDVHLVEAIVQTPGITDELLVRARARACARQAAARGADAHMRICGGDT